MLRIGQQPVTVEERYEHVLRQVALGADLDAPTGLYEGSPRLSRRAMRRKAHAVLDAIEFEQKVRALAASGQTGETEHA